MYINKLLFCLLLVGCGKPADENKEATTSTSASSFKRIDGNEGSPTESTVQELGAFLDSVGHLPTQPLVDKAEKYANSLFSHKPANSWVLTASDYARLQAAAQKGSMKIEAAQRIFGDTALGLECHREGLFTTYPKDRISITYYPFSGNAFDEFAIGVGLSEHCQHAPLFFFKKNKLIATHDGYSHYGLSLRHYKDEDDKTVVYYTHEFQSGSGIWWNNLFFYKYDDDKLLPILNELKDGNSTFFWGFRALWLESTVQSTRPLRIKMVYYSQLPDTTRTDYGPLVINDSAVIQYSWNTQKQELEMQPSKMTRAQILSYSVQNNDLLFINVYYKEIKKLLNNSVDRKAVLNYLSKVKNMYQ